MVSVPSLSTLENEHSELVFRTFTSDTAFSLGAALREKAKMSYPGKPVAIRITLSDGQILFAATAAPGTIPDTETWLARKAATVRRFGVSTLYMREKLKAAGFSTIGQKYLDADDKLFAAHGGGFPIRVKGVEGVVATCVASGLAQEQDHALVVEGLRSFLTSSS